jgi:hypothetical protein
MWAQISGYKHKLLIAVSEIVEADGVGEIGLGGKRALVAPEALAEYLRALDF